MGSLLISFIALFIKFKVEINLSRLYTVIILILADILLVTAGVYEYSKLISLITGLLFGIVIYFFFLEMIKNSIWEKSAVGSNA